MKLLTLNHKQKIAIIGSVLYTLIIGIGMYISYHINGKSYKDPELVNTLWVVEIVLTLLTVFITLKYFSWEEVGFVKINYKQLVWLLPSFLIVVLAMGIIGEHFIITELSREQVNLFLLVGFTTFLVGFSEELMYRGIVLNSFLKDKSKIAAVLISAICFSLLHAVNILAGLSFGDMFTQLILTFLFGLFTALIFLKIKNIIPLIIFHWLWDFILIGSSVIGAEGKLGVTSFNIVIEMVVIIILFIILVRNREKS